MGIGGATLVLAALPFGPSAVGDTEGIYGFNMVTSATALMMTYDQPSVGLPARPTFEVRKVHSVATLDSGPSGRALASIAWPGDLIGNAPPELAIDSLTADPTNGDWEPWNAYCGEHGGCLEEHIARAREPLRQGFQYNCTAPDGAPPSGTGNPCTWPVRAESFYPQGPAETRNETGLGVGMRSKAEETVSEAVATMQRAGFPSAFSLGAMNSSSFSGVVKDAAVSEARTHITDVDLLGQIHIESVTSFAKAVSDGVKATLEGSVNVAGLTIAGRKLTVDGTGLHYPDGAADPYGTYAKKYIDENLAPRGINLTIVQPVDTKNGSAASRTVSGLIITLESKGMRELIASLPAPLSDWFRNPTDSPLSAAFDPFKPFAVGMLTSPIRFDGTMKIILGNIVVDSNASPPYTLPEISPPDIAPPPVIPGPVSPIDTGPIVAPPAAAPPAQAPQLNAVPVASVKGLNGGLFGGLLGVLALAGALLGPRMADRLWVAKPATICPLEASE
jgi:hypothetical protein